MFCSPPCTSLELSFPWKQYLADSADKELSAAAKMSKIRSEKEFL
jgi:hypothetical protein